MALDRHERAPSVRAARRHGKALLTLEQLPQTLQHDRVIVDQDEADWGSRLSHIYRWVYESEPSTYSHRNRSSLC